MKRLVSVLSLLVLGVVVSSCAVGNPKPTSAITDTSATLNADISSSFAGDTTYFWKYGQTIPYANETTHRTVAISDDQPHPVSEPLTGLTPGTTYHFQLCASDEQENPPRVNCSKDGTFATQLLDRANGTATNGTRPAYAANRRRIEWTIRREPLGHRDRSSALSTDSRGFSRDCGLPRGRWQHRDRWLHRAAIHRWRHGATTTITERSLTQELPARTPSMRNPAI